MPAPDPFLYVLPNPYASVDPFGQPAGAVLFEPPSDGFAASDFAGYVGARVDPARTTRQRLDKGDTRSPLQNTAYRFDTKTPVKVANSAYYLARLREGALLPADEHTAQMASVPFVSPDKATAAAKDAQAALWKTRHGQDLPAADEGAT